MRRRIRVLRNPKPSLLLFLNSHPKGLDHLQMNQGEITRGDEVVKDSAISRWFRSTFTNFLKKFDILSNGSEDTKHVWFDSRWDNRTSVVIPDEEVFYLVAFLSSAPPSSDHDSLEHALKRNDKILDFCEKAGIRMKQYLPHYTTKEEWKAHFGSRWEMFAWRKAIYDPLAILTPG